MLSVSARDAVAFRVAAHGLLRRQSSVSAAARVALPDYPRGAAVRALAARCTSVSAATLPDELAAGTLVRSYSLRGTTHVFATSVAAAYTTGVLPVPGSEPAAQDALGSSWPTFSALGIPAVDALARVSEALGSVADDGSPRTKGELSAALHGLLPSSWEPWCERCRANHTPDLLFRLALISAGLRFAGDGPALTVGPRPDLATHTAARADLVRLFLSAYAPASASAFAEWTGLGRSEASSSFAALGDELTKVRLDGRPAFCLTTDVRHLEHPPSPTGSLRLLAPGDPFLHQRDRATLLPDPTHRRTLWRPAGSPGLILQNATPIGTWREKATTITPTFWAPPPPESALQAELHTLTQLSSP